MVGDDELVLTQLDNGLTVATERVPGARSVAIGAWVAVGARDEPSERAGVSHFLEHVLFKGTHTRSARDIATAIERVGGDLNAFTAKEYTAYHCRVPYTHAATAIDVLGDVLVSPALRDDDIESERSVILEELAMDEDSPEDVVHRHLVAALFPGHPLGRDTGGDRDTVALVSADDVRGFLTRWYTASNVVLAVAGPLGHDEIVRHVDRALSSLPAGGEQPVRRAPTATTDADVLLHDDVEQAQVAVGMRAYGRDDGRSEALDVLAHVLGGGPSSRLFEEIRERRGLAYSVYAATSAYQDAGALAVYAGTSGENVDTVIGVVGDELDRIAAEGISDDELDVAVGYLVGSYLLGLEDTGARMGRVGAQLVTRGSVRPVAEQLARWQAVTPAAVVAVARDLLGSRVHAVLRPVG